LTLSSDSCYKLSSVVVNCSISFEFGREEGGGRSKVLCEGIAMKLFDLLVLVTLCTLTVVVGSSKEATTFPGETKVIEHLASKLSRKECWVVGNYLAQKSAKPVQAQTKMVKTGGHVKDFDCLAGLRLWASVILPPMLEKVQQKQRFVS